MKMRCVVMMMVVGCLGSSLLGTDKKYIAQEPKTDLPFSEGVLVGNTLYIAGHLGLDPKTSKPPASVDEEARLVMEAIKKTVESAGMTMDDVVMMQISCPDLTLYDTFNKVYRTYFHGEFPARAFLGSGKLLRDAHFEVLGVAVKRAK